MPTVPSDQVTGETPRQREESTLRQLLEAAAARPDELPSLSPFFAARVRALARERGDRRSVQLVARVAWHALPALAAVVVVLSLWAGLELGRDTEAQEDVAMVVLQSRDTGADAPLTALLLGGGGEISSQGGAR
ncbi:MAG: hypothetical protein ABR961_12465 [Thermoanaerobaculaceae bacterium]|jgi:hypothetical protein